MTDSLLRQAVRGVKRWRHSFHARVTVLIAGVFSVLSIVLFGALVAYFTVKLFEEEQEELSKLSGHLRELVDHVDMAHMTIPELMPVLRQQMEDKLIFTFTESREDFAYALYDKTGHMLYSYAAEGQPEFPPTPWIQDFRAVPSSYKSWTFYQGVTGRQVDAMVSSSHHFTVIDHLLIGGAILLPLTVLVSTIVAFLIARRVLVPMAAIASTAIQIERGELSARVRAPSSGEEVDQLVATLNQTFQELQDSFQRVEQFSADAAHELRTPLTAIRGGLEVCLRQDRGVEEYQEAIASAVDEIARLNVIIDTLLTLARNPTDVSHARLTLVDFSSVVSSAVEQFSILAEVAELQITADIEPGLHVHGIGQFLTQLCYNLLQNAIRYTPAGGRITVALSAVENEIVFTVADTGVGIAPELHEKIFNRFFQAGSRRSEGAGLGLAIVKWIVNCHHGSISLSSTPELGSKFRVVLPRPDTSTTNSSSPAR